MKKILKISLVIAAFFLVFGIQKSFAEEDFYSKDEYIEKYGNKVLVFVDKNGTIMSEQNIPYIKVGDCIEYDAMLVDIDELYNSSIQPPENYEIIDFDDLTVISEIHPNLVSRGNGKITALAEGFYNMLCTYEKDGIVYKLVNRFNPNGLDLTSSLRLSITPNGGKDYGSYLHSAFSCFDDENYSYVTIDNSRMLLNKESNTDTVSVECFSDLLWREDPLPDIYSFEWSIDDDSIVSIEDYVSDPDSKFNVWSSEKKIIAKKNGTTKVRCKASMVLENGETQVIEKVIDVTVTGFDEENNNEEEPKKEEENKENTDDSVANKPLANTGAKFPFVLIAVLAIAGIAYRNYKKYNFKM